jgi:rod shape-determining protein MreD
MKKILIIIGVFISFILIYFLQINFFNWYNIAGIQPNLFIVLALFIGLYIGKNYGLVIGMILGLLLDLFMSKIIGTNFLIMGLSGLLGGIYNKNFSKERLITLMLMVAGTTILCETVVYMIQIIFLKVEVSILQYIYIVFIEAIYNVILIIILNPVIQKIGNSIEENFKKETTFSKYL